MSEIVACKECGNFYTMPMHGRIPWYPGESMVGEKKLCRALDEPEEHFDPITGKTSEIKKMNDIDQIRGTNQGCDFYKPIQNT